MNLFNTLEKLCSMHAPSGFESPLIVFLSDWFKKQDTKAMVDDYSINNTLLISKGNPKVAFIAHADSVGFILQYNNRLLALGSPEVNEHSIIVSEDGKKAGLKFKDDENIFLKSEIPFEIGTTFTFVPDFEVTENSIQSPYLDDRMGIALLMQLFLESKDIFIVISSNEETCGGSVEKASRIMYEQFGLKKAIIVDTTFDTEGIHMGDGIVLSLKDRYLPPERFVKEVKSILNHCNIPFQLEVEDYGSSDGAYIHKGPYPMDWCFLGIACKNNHSHQETIHIQDMNYLYEALTRINQMLNSK